MEAGRYEQVLSSIENPSVANALRGVATLEILDPSVEYTLRNPEAVAARFGKAHPHFIETEAYTPTNVAEIRTLVPAEIREEHLDLYLDHWGAQEPMHAELLRNLHVNRLGLDLPAAFTRDIPRSFERLGKLAALIPSVGRIVTFHIAMTSSAHEQSTLGSYGQYSQRLREMGEDDLADKVILPIYRQEGPHGRYGKAVAKDMWGQMGRRERWIARELFTRTYNPVGVRAEQHKPAVGAVIDSLIGEDLSSAADPVQKLIMRTMPLDKKLSRIRESASGILSSKYTSCIIEALADCREAFLTQEELRAA